MPFGNSNNGFGGAGGGSGTGTNGTAGTSGISGLTPSQYILTAFLPNNQTITTGGSNKVINLQAGSDPQS